MSDSSNSFSDPKVIFSLIALAISVMNFFWSLFNQREQNRRWEVINSPNPELKEIRMVNWKEISYAEAHSINWGYDPTIYSKGEATNLYVLPYFIFARDSLDKKIDLINPVFTVNEIEAELKRIGYPPQSHISLKKLFRPRLIFENMGKAELKNLSIKIDAKLPNADWINAFTSNTEINIAGGQTSTVLFDIELPLDQKLPDYISFKVILDFRDVNSKWVKKEILTRWTTNDNLWSYESRENLN